MKTLSVMLLLSVALSTPVLGQVPPLPQEHLSKKEASELNKARTNLEKVKERTEQATSDIKAAIQDVEARLYKIEQESVKAMGQKEARTERMASQVELAQSAQLEVATKEGVKILNKMLRLLKRRLDAEEELLEEAEETVKLLERKARLKEEVETLSVDEAAGAKTEVLVAEARLQDAQGTLEQKQVALQKSKDAFKEARREAREGQKQLKEESEGLERLPAQEGETAEAFIASRKLLYEIRTSNLEEEVSVAQNTVKLAETQLEIARIDALNAHQKLVLLKQRSSSLDKKVEAVEIARLKKESQLARRTEEEKRKEARAEILALRKEEEEALKKAQELERRLQEDISAEERLSLELESTVLKLRGGIAKKKDTIITEETRRYRNDTDFKKLNEDVHVMLGGENTLAEMKADLAQLNEQTEIWDEKLEVVSGLSETIRKETTVVSERLELAKAELVAPPGGTSEIEQQAGTFKDKGMAEKYVAYARERVELLEKEKTLLEELVTRIEKERKVVILEGIKLVENAKKELSEIAVVNIWTRRSWSGSWSGLKKTVRRMLSPGELSDVITVMEDATPGKLRISISIAGILALIAATIVGSYYARKWCRANLSRHKEAGH